MAITALTRDELADWLWYCRRAIGGGHASYPSSSSRSRTLDHESSFANQSEFKHMKTPAEIKEELRRKRQARMAAEAEAREGRPPIDDKQRTAPIRAEDTRS